jgi:hypothetical protein
VSYPKVLRIRQSFEPPRVENVADRVQQALERLELGQRIRPGQTVALTAGSRGIANIPVILKSAVDHLKKLSAKPFIVPAMGSHGGGTAEGQRHIIESYGITEEFVGAPIKASMEVVTVGTTPDGCPVYLDKHASQADHIGVVGRVKPHTNYHGPIESGLLKMMMIGLGKHVGALAYHRILLEKPYDAVVRSVGRLMCARAPISFGVATVENAYDETARIEAIRPAEFEKVEEELLTLARRWLMRLPFHEADLLIIDEIGKNISGSGMDTNVVGRKRALRSQVAAPDQPQMRHIFIRGLTDKTHGNAAGIGLADFTTSRVIRDMDYRATRINCLTAGYPEGAILPVHFDTDREVIDAALAIAGTRKIDEARVMRIRNTLALEEMEISEACLGEKRCTEFAPSSAAREMRFEPAGNLPPL